MTALRERRVGELIEAYRRHRFAWLFVTLLLALAAAPVLEAVLPGIPALELLLGISLLAAIGSAEPKSWLKWLFALGAIFLAVRVAQAMTGSAALLSVSQLVWLITAVAATFSAVHYALRPGVVDGERIFAALDVYLMVGLIFAVGYWLLDQAAPASFGAPSDTSISLRQSVYFSFVTMATLGYGDIVPASDFARSLAIVQAISGQLYLAVLVARLVSLYAKQTD